jgi:hypothetical protein
MAADNTNPDTLSTTIFVILAAGAVAFFGVVYVFVLR